MKILVSASDPGGGNAVLPVVKALMKKNADVITVLGGKSREVFEREKISFIDEKYFKNNTKIEIFFQEHLFDAFFFSTSLGKTIDKKLIKYVKRHGITSFAIFDFWSNYWERFEGYEKSALYLPDYICVMDRRAKKEMLRAKFPEKLIIVTGNPYYEYFTQDIHMSPKNSRRILFVSQPIKELEDFDKDYGFNEFSVLEDVLSVLKMLKSKFEFYIRMHPRDEKGKFHPIIKRYEVKVYFDKEKSLEKSLTKTRVVLGMNSTVLFQAAMAGKNVISYQPHLIGEDVLPSNRMRISTLVKSKKALGKIIFNRLLRQDKKAKRGVSKNATNNVVNFIYKKLENKK